MPPRRTPKPPSATDPEACVKCGQPGSTCGDCGVVLCYGCNVNPHVAQGHPPKAHLEAMDPELLKPKPRPVLPPPPAEVMHQHAVVSGILDQKAAAQKKTKPRGQLAPKAKQNA